MKKRVLCVVLCAVLLCAALPGLPVLAEGEPAASGFCGREGDGSGVAWSLDAAGVLTISGTGDMADYAFYREVPWNSSRKNLTAAVIEPGVTSVGANAFYGCTGLTEVTVPAGVTEIGYSAFRGCTGLTELTLPAGMTAVRDSAFYNCTGLTEVSIPAGVTVIETWAFYNCTGLKRVTLPESLNAIGDWAFYNCAGLSSLTVPEGTAELGRCAFSGCEALEYAAIPAGVQSIGEDAFLDCGRLVLSVAAGSAALEYAAAHAIPYTVTETALPGAVRYVPYCAEVGSILTGGAGFETLRCDGTLPPELVLDPERGLLEGIPVREGAYALAFTAVFGGREITGSFTLEVLPGRTDSPLEGSSPDYAPTVLLPAALDLSNVPAGGFDFTLAGTGAELEGVYLDGRALTGNTDYTVEADAAVIRISGDALSGLSQGEHTLAAAYRVGVTGESARGALRVSAQTFTVTGAAPEPSSPGQEPPQAEPSPAPEPSPVPEPSPTPTPARLLLPVPPGTLYSSSGNSSGSAPSASPAPSSQAMEPVTAAELVDGYVELQYDVSKETVTVRSIPPETEELFGHYSNPGAVVTVTDPNVSSVVIPAPVVTTLAEKLSDGETQVGTLTVRLPAGDIIIDEISMAAVESQSAGQPARFTAITLTVEMLNVRQFEALSGRRVYGGMRVTAVAGSREIERFGGGRITIRVPVDLPAGADGREYAVFHLAEDGTVNRHASVCRDGYIEFRTAHFSDYVALADPMARFSDVPEDKWYTDAVDYVLKDNLMHGNSGYLFDPDGTLTRAMFAQILYNMEADIPGAADAGFVDVPKTAWYCGAVNWAASVGIVNGVGGGYFNPEGTVSREHLAVMLYNYAKYKGYDTSHAADLGRFRDGGSVSPWAREAMSWMAGEKMITGYDLYTLLPREPATRAQIAKILAYFRESYEL